MPRDWCPFAVRDPLGPNPGREGHIQGPDIICVHTMVGSLMGTDSYFENEGYVGVESHFGIGNECDGPRDGQIRQWQELSYQADANYLADNVISIETSDCTHWQRPWSPAQVDSLVRLISWLADEFDIPRRLVANTRPGQRGIAFHRQGCDPWRVGGGVKWSSHYGKVCPGDTRINQLKHEVIPRIQGRDGGWDNDGFPDGLLLERGSTGRWVRKLQHALALLGYGNTVDGIYGLGTEQRVENYQRDEDILVDGIAGPTTLAHIEKDVDMANKQDIKDALREFFAEEESVDDPRVTPVNKGGKASSDQMTPVDVWREILGYLEPKEISRNVWTGEKYDSRTRTPVEHGQPASDDDHDPLWFLTQSHKAVTEFNIDVNAENVATRIFTYMEPHRIAESIAAAYGEDVEKLTATIGELNARLEAAGNADTAS